MTAVKLWTIVFGHPLDEGTLEITPFATRSDRAHLTLKDEDGNEAYVTVDVDGLAAIIEALQDQLDEMLPEIDEDYVDIEEEDT